MQKNVLWAGTACHSLENCLLTTTGEGTRIQSMIVGACEGNIYQVGYFIETNANWETTCVEIRSQANNKTMTRRFQGDGKGNWFSGGNRLYEFDGCMDVDIVLTPFTNTLPVKRLHPLKGRTRINVIYVDIPEQQVYAVEQYYTRLSATAYKFEQPRDNFEAIITMDAFGLVKDYPELFKQVIVKDSSYAADGQ